MAYPETQPKTFLNEFVSNVNFSSTGADLGFGFNASYVRLRNRAAKSIYFTLKSTTGATTDGHELGSSEDLQIVPLSGGMAGLSFVATSSGGFLSVGAWG